MANFKTECTQKDFTFHDETYWEVLSHECESCNFTFDSNDEEDTCESCGSNDLIPSWNYEGEECKICSKHFEVQESFYSKTDGDFSDVICETCFNELPEDESDKE